MTYEYFWLRNYIPLISEGQVKQELIQRTGIFNSLGNEGWELLPNLSETGAFCFRRPRNNLHRTRYEYYWLRDYIPILSDKQIQQDMDKRSKLFNELSVHNWELIMDDLSMFCFIRVKE